MLELLKRMTLGRAVQLALAATIVAMLLAAGSILQWLGPARTLRWGALLVLAALAVAYAARSSASARWVAPGLLLAGGLLGVAVVSALWSAAPRLTLGRAAAFALVLVIAAALARAGSPELVLEGVVLGAVAVAVGGLLVLVFAHDRAVQPATTVSPARYQGLGGGPNMAPMVFALAAPLALHFALEARTRTMRVVWGASLALLLGSIAFSGSRGALAAVFTGLAVYSLLVRRPVVLGTAALLTVATLALSVLPAPASSNPPQPTGQDPNPAQVTPAPGYLDANLQGVRLQDDIGHPGAGVADTNRRERTLLGSSGRSEAWRGALGLVTDRALVGYGFGTEDRTFVDRYVFFNSNVPENSYLGILLQLGVVGLVLLLALAAALMMPAVRRGTPRIAVAAAAAFAAALVLALFQSYLYAPGNAATITAWICAFAVSGAAAAAARPRRILLGGMVALVALVAVGTWERERRADGESAGMRSVLEVVGPLDSRDLRGFRIFVNFQCLVYKRGRNDFSLELCVDDKGRVVEAIDRRDGTADVWSLRDDPSRSKVLVDRGEVNRLLQRMNVPEEYLSGS